jgi:hypothetical protein
MSVMEFHEIKLTSRLKETEPCLQSAVMLLKIPFMKILYSVWLVTLSTAAFAHPGGGIIALSENSTIFADSTENFTGSSTREKSRKCSFQNSMAIG